MAAKKKMVDLMAKRQMAAVAAGATDSRIVRIKSINEFCNLAKEAQASIKRDVRTHSLVFAHKGALFLFREYEFGVEAQAW